MAKAKARIGAADAERIRKEYVEGNDSLKQLAERHGVSRRWIERLSSKERWTRLRMEYRTKVMPEDRDARLNAIRACAADALTGVKNALETATDVGDLYTIVRALKVTADIEFKTGGRLTPGEQARYDIELKRMEAEKERRSGVNEVKVVWADEALKELGE